MKTDEPKHSYVRRAEGAVVIKPHKDLMGGEETDELEKLIDDFDREGVPCLVINLFDVSMMNSLALSRLIRGHIKFTKRKARMSLCQLDARIQNILVITKLSFVFDVYPSEEKAIAACSARES